MVTNANAATYNAACRTTGANGSLTFTNPTALYTPINGWVNDNAADGHHVAIRFISNNTSTTKYWPWHHEYGGHGTSLVITTSATDSSGGLNYLGLQVATMEGSRVVDICTDWVGSGSPPS